MGKELTGIRGWLLIYVIIILLAGISFIVLGLINMPSALDANK